MSTKSSMSTNSDKFYSYCDYCNEFKLCEVVPEFEPLKVKLCETCLDNKPAPAKDPQEQLLEQVAELKYQLEKREKDAEDRRSAIGLIFVVLGLATCFFTCFFSELGQHILHLLMLGL
jgi:hypothetical protein